MTPAASAKVAHAGGARSTGFGATVFDLVGETPVVRRRGPDSPFDVCHVGVALRAVLFVHAAVAIGMVFPATSFGYWLALTAAGAGVALPAVLGWLLVLCAAKRPLAAAPLAAQWSAVMVLGAITGWGSAQLMASLFPDVNAAGLSSLAGPGPAIAGAAMASVIFQWLRLRAQATLPAETTARLAELQSRIRPHFLFNTLNSAIALVRAEPARAEALLEDLSDLFRHALVDQGESVTLAQETTLAERYLSIEQVRFGDRLRIHWALDPHAAGAQLPPLLLQPLVENAVKHGVEPSASGADVRISTERRGSTVVIKIANTVPGGQGIPGHGLALNNVRDRLNLLHDMQGQFQATFKNGHYLVRIEIPI